MSKKYAKPPVIEVSCEFLFNVKDPNDLTVPGRFYDSENIKENYPIKEELQEIIIGFGVNPTEIPQKLHRKILGMQYKSQNGKVIIRVSPNFVSIHHLTPYSSWENFSLHIKQGFKTFQKVVEPISLERVGLRYIDKIEIPSPSFELEEYFLIYPKIPEKFKLDNFFLRLEIPFNGGRDLLIIMMYKQPLREAEKTLIILDWDYILIQPSQIPFEKILDWVEEAHKKIIDIFESSITDKCRQLFE